MNILSVRCAWPLLVAALLSASPSALALQAGANVSLDVTETDNALLDAVNKIDDQIVAGQIDGNISEDAGRLTGAADFSLQRLNYLNNTFDPKTYLGLSSQALWQQISNVLSWRIHDYYSQTSINTFASSTPANTQNVNAFGVNANLGLQLTARQRLTLVPAFDDYSYQSTTNDNRQTGLTAGWSYALSPGMSTSVNGSFKHTDYAAPGGFDNDRKTVSIGLSGTGGRTQYRGDVGLTRVDRDTLADSKA